MPKRCFTMPMRAIWTGSIAFGLVNVPVKAYGATEDHDIDLHQVHDKDGGRIRYERRCEVCGEKVAYKDLDKAFEDGERTIVLTDEDMDVLPAEKSREIEVVQFVPADQIDPLMLEKSYFLRPTPSRPRPMSCCAGPWRIPSSWRWCVSRCARRRAWACCACAPL